MAKVDPMIEALARVPILQNLTPRQLKELTATAKERTYPPGAQVVKAGDAGIGLYLILDGEVEVRREQHPLARFGHGQFFGELTLLDQEARSADVVAIRPTRCLVLSSWEFWSWATDKPLVLRGMLTEMARRLRQMDKALAP